MHPINGRKKSSNYSHLQTTLIISQENGPPSSAINAPNLNMPEALLPFINGSETPSITTGPITK
jgi:hypothetical protein